MTLYRNLGPITFLSQTQAFEIFSGSHAILILQFKNYEQFDSVSITQVLAVYDLILKHQKLLQIYSQKHKPSSILIHNAVKVVFNKINVQHLCRIIKEMVTSIFHTQKIAPNKIGEITRDMFYQINGELRYLYFPTRQKSHKSQEIVTEVLQFFNSLKDEKQVSHRLLLKKISKCTSLQEILQQTDYFFSIYHAKQSSTLIQPLNTLNKQRFSRKVINNPKLSIQTINQTNVSQIRCDNRLGIDCHLNNGKNVSRRKLKLFKNADSNSLKSVSSQPNSQFYLNTWRKPKKESLYQNSTFRTNSTAVHLDLSQTSVKKCSASLFSRASSIRKSPRKLSNYIGKVQGDSFHRHNQNQVSTNESFIHSKNSNFSKSKGNLDTNKKVSSSRLKELYLSHNLNQSVCSLKQDDGSQLQKGSSSSAWMKQMVNNSLQKWKQKSKPKMNVFTKIKDNEREESTLVDINSKVIQNLERPSYDTLRESKVSLLNQSKCTKNNELKQFQAPQIQKYQPLGSQKKLRRGKINNHSTLVESIKPQIVKQKVVLPYKNSQKLQFQVTNNLNEKQEKCKIIQRQVESLEEINFAQSSIEQLTMKNKQEQLRLSRDFEKKKTSIKEIDQDKKRERNVSDKLDTQKIQQSRQNIKASNKKENNSQHEEQIQQYLNRLPKINHQKQQIDYIGVAVVQTSGHLKSFQSIFWQLPMFFLYKKFYEKRMKLLQSFNELLTDVKNQIDKLKQFQSLQAKLRDNFQQIQAQNLNIQQSLKKLLKTVKKKIKKQHPLKEEQQYIEKHLHLDFTIPYDQAADQFLSMYLNSLQEARSQFPELIFHVIDILEAVVVYKGKEICPKDRQSFESCKNNSDRLEKAEIYYNALLKEKDIQSTFKFAQIQNKK